MRRYNWLMTILAVVAVAFAACEKNKIDDEKPSDDPTPVELTFTVETKDVTKNTLTYDVTPSDLEAEYLAVAFTAAAVEACADDSAIVKMVYDDIKAYAESVGKTFSGYMSEHVAKGEQKDVTIDGLSVETDYYLLIFGVDAAKEYAATSAVSLTRFKTKGVDQSSCTFEVKATPYLNSATIKVKPSVINQTWAIVNVPVEKYTTYTSAEGEYKWTMGEFFSNHVQTQYDSLKEEGLSDDEIAIRLIHNGIKTLYAGDLQPKTKYTCLVAAVEVDSDGTIYISGEPKEVRYNAGEKAESDLTFDIEVYNVKNYSAEIRITPSDPKAKYYYYISYIDSPKRDMKLLDLANSVATEYIYYWDNNELKHREPVSGTIDLTGDNKVELDIAETEYYVVAFSYELNPSYGKVTNEETGEYDSNPGTITSAPVFVSFVTGVQGDAKSAEFEFKASEVGPYDLTLEVDAKDPTIYYQVGLAYADSFNAQKAIAENSAMLAQVMQMCMEGQSPSLTIQEALETKCSHLYRNGDGKYYIANLLPEHDIIGYVLTIDSKTGKFAACVNSDVIATTVKPGSVTPKLELLGVYDGDDEKGDIFGNAELTKGKPIVAVKHTDYDGASALYCALSKDPYVDVETKADNYIISSFRGYWQEVNLTVPYHFMVASWDTDQTVVAYAQDANGHEAGVARLAVKPSKAGDINELKGYVDAVNAASKPATFAKSLVVMEPAMPTIECLWSEEVGAPREAEITKHVVLPPSQSSDLVEVSVVKSFRL